MTDVFIGYARDDYSVAQNIARALEAQGLSVWWDRDIAPGRSWDEVIEDALRGSAAILILWSKVGVKSHWLRAEAQFAVDDEKYVPLTVDGTPLPMGFRPYTPLDLRGWKGNPADSRLKTLEAKVRELSGKPAPEPEPEPDRWTFISHAEEDRPFIEKWILPPIHQSGRTTWYSPIDLRTGDWAKGVVKGLRACRWFLVVLSPDAVTSEWVADEVHWAVLKRRSRIIPVMHREADVYDLHISLARLQYVDFTVDPHRAQEKLMRMWSDSVQGGRLTFA